MPVSFLKIVLAFYDTLDTLILIGPEHSTDSGVQSRRRWAWWGQSTAVTQVLTEYGPCACSPIVPQSDKPFVPTYAVDHTGQVAQTSTTYTNIKERL
jgi:hypothetical protein